MTKAKLYKLTNTSLNLILGSALLIYLISHFMDRYASLPINAVQTKTTSSILFMTTLIVLMLINWGLEGIKWYGLIKKIKILSLSQVIYSILIGLMSNILAPNRTGELAGRLKYLPRNRSWEGLYLNFVNASSQFLITICIGIMAFAFLYEQLELPLNSLLSSVLIYLSPVLVALFISLFLYTNLLNRLFYFIKQKWVSPNFIQIRISRVEKLRLLFMSLGRYLIFALQFHLILHLLGSGHTFLLHSCALAIIFLINSAVPSFCLSELIVRSSAAYFIFDLLAMDPITGVAATFSLWAINIFFPSLIALLALKEVNWVGILKRN